MASNDQFYHFQNPSLKLRIPNVCRRKIFPNRFLNKVQNLVLVFLFQRLHTKRASKACAVLLMRLSLHCVIQTLLSNRALSQNKIYEILNLIECMCSTLSHHYINEGMQFRSFSEGLRRGRDSNPRYLAVYPLSKRAH